MTATAKTAPKAPPAKAAAKTAPKEKKPSASRSNFATIYPEDAAVAITTPDSANPKRAGSKAAEMFELYREHKTVGAFLAAGGTYADIAYNVGRGFIKVGKMGFRGDEEGGGVTFLVRFEEPMGGALTFRLDEKDRIVQTDVFISQGLGLQDPEGVELLFPLEDKLKGG